jgi:hypothetical protein
MFSRRVSPVVLEGGKRRMHMHYAQSKDAIKMWPRRCRKPKMRVTRTWRRALMGKYLRHSLRVRAL